ncbi:MAG: hypothetical protein M3P94_05595, partial [Chloroflexota bacterium]|nr:hypothetical protein [Chloroflexota bacterium]
GGQGVRAMQITPRTGPIVAAGQPEPDDQVVLLSTSGIVIRILASQISRIGRATQGVMLMRVAGNVQVASMTIMQPRDVEDELVMAAGLSGTLATAPATAVTAPIAPASPPSPNGRHD